MDPQDLGRRFGFYSDSKYMRLETIAHASRVRARTAGFWDRTNAADDHYSAYSERPTVSGVRPPHRQHDEWTP